MPEQASFVQERVDQFNAAFDSVSDEVQRVQKQLRTRRKTFERQLSDRRKKLEKSTRKQVNKIESDFKKSDVGKRARSLRADAEKRFERGIEGVLGVLQIASKGDVQKLDRKIGQISRKLKDIERAKKANGDAAHI
jgi:hypothetical protein